MPVSLHSLAELSDADRIRVESCLLAFDRAWTPDALPEYVRGLTTEPEPLRRLLLVELVKIDLERQWAAGSQRSLEEYLDDFPALGTPQTVSPELIAAEYEARHQAGHQPSIEEYATRFPRQANAIRSLTERSRSSMSVIHSLRRTLGTLGDTNSVVRRQVAAASRSEPAVEATGLPKQFGRYRIERQLGAGAMGAVYLAYDEKLQRQVALKVPSFARSDAAEMIQRFAREAQSAALLRHANICPVYDVGDIDGIHYITMAYIEGRALSAFISPEKPIAERVAAAVVRKLTLALDHAHAHGVIHRDLKPDNIMIDRQREPLVMDFGLARQLKSDDAARVTQSGMILGTPAYMSPEQVRGEELGPASDIYSLGVILYELLTGRLPFQGAFGFVLVQIVSTEPERPSAFRPGLDSRLEAICRKMMVKNIADRYQSMRQVADDLAEFLKATANAAGLGAATPSMAIKNADREALADLVPVRVGGHPTRPTIGEAVPKPATRSGRWTGPTIATVVSLVATVMFLGILLFLRTEHGTIRIAVNDPDLVVRIDGKHVRVEGLREPLQLKTGRHTLSVEHAGQVVKPGDVLTISTTKRQLAVRFGSAELRGSEFVVSQGSNPVLQVELVSIAEAVPSEPADVSPEEVPAPGGLHRATDYALQFDGKSHVTIPTFRYKGDHPLTIEVYVFSDSLHDGIPTIVADTESGGMCLGTEGMQVHGTKYDVVASRTAVLPKRRYHLAGTFDPQTGEITYFVNGRLNTTHRLSGRFKPSSYPMTLAASPTSGNKAHYHWQGCLEQVRISNTIRYRDNFEPDDELRADDHALLVLPLNEGSGPTVFDASGHNHHGIIIGARWVRVRQPIPGSLEISEAEAQLAHELQAANDSDDSADARMLLDELLKRPDTRKHPALHYSALRKAIESATRAGDFQAATVRCDELGLYFDSDPVAQKLELMRRFESSVTQPQASSALAATALSLATDLLADFRYDGARQLMPLASAAAERSEESHLIWHAEFLANEIKSQSAAYESVRDARDRLRQNAADPKARLDWGKFLCFHRNEWGSGLRLIADAGDSDLSLLATADLQALPTADGQAELADRWWDQSGQVSAFERSACRKRARYWYMRAMAATQNPELRDRCDLRVRLVPTERAELRVRAERVDVHTLQITTDGLVSSTKYTWPHGSLNGLPWFPQGAVQIGNFGSGRLLPDAIDFSAATLKVHDKGKSMNVDLTTAPDRARLSMVHSPVGSTHVDASVTFDAWTPRFRVEPQKVEAWSQEARIRLYAAEEGVPFVIRNVTGDAQVTPTSGTLPALVTVRAPDAYLCRFQFEVQPIGAREAQTVSGFLIPAEWSARFYAWKRVDKRGPTDEAWQQMLAGGPLETQTLTAPLFQWGEGSPSKKVPKDYFAMVATTELHVPEGEYTISTWSDEAVRIFVDDQLVADAWWLGHGHKTHSKLKLERGRHAVRAEFLEGWGWAQLSFDFRPAEAPSPSK